MSESCGWTATRSAGLLRELFGAELTAARGVCAGCGAVDAVGAGHVYAEPQAPGAVLRCCHCETLLAVVVQRNGSTRFAFSGLVWLET